MSKFSINFSFLKNINFRAIPETVNAIAKAGKQHAPTILTIVGITGFWAAGVMTAMEVPKVEEAIAQEASRRAENGLEPLDRLDKGKIIAEHMWRPAAVAGASTIAVAGANKINLSRLAGMTALYRSAKGELSAIQDRVLNKESDGLKKSDLEKARQQIHRTEYEKNPVREGDRIHETGNGNTLFVETYSGARFHSSVTAVNTAITELNTRLQEDQYLALDEFYDMLDIDTRSRKCGKYAAFRLNGKYDLIHPNQILDWRDYVDPTTGEPRICFIDFERFLTPSDDFAERNPW